MFNADSTILIRLAAMVWLSGVIILSVKSSSLLMTAYENGVSFFLILHAVSGGIVIGAVKARFLFYRIGKKNIDRIRSLKHPRLWQFYRTRFFIFLLTMIVTGKVLAEAAQGSNGALLALAVLEISVAAALLFSSYCYWE